MASSSTNVDLVISEPMDRSNEYVIEVMLCVDVHHCTGQARLHIAWHL